MLPQSDGQILATAEGKALSSSSSARHFKVVTSIRFDTHNAANVYVSLPSDEYLASVHKPIAEGQPLSPFTTLSKAGDKRTSLLHSTTTNFRLLNHFSMLNPGLGGCKKGSGDACHNFRNKEREAWTDRNH